MEDRIIVSDEVLKSISEEIIDNNMQSYEELGK